MQGAFASSRNGNIELLLTLIPSSYYGQDGPRIAETQQSGSQIRAPGRQALSCDMFWTFDRGNQNLS